MEIKLEDEKNLLIISGMDVLVSEGYLNVTRDNILTDITYSELFKSMLLRLKGKRGENTDTGIEELLKQIL